MEINIEPIKRNSPIISYVAGTSLLSIAAIIEHNIVAGIVIAGMSLIILGLIIAMSRT